MGTRKRGADIEWLRKFSSRHAHMSVLAASDLILEDCVLWWDDIENKQRHSTTKETSFRVWKLC